MAMIPTVEEFLTKELSKLPTGTKGEFVRLSADADKALYDAMIEFAKLHVEAALKEVLNNTENWDDCKVIPVEKVLNAYPLENIK